MAKTPPTTLAADAARVLPDYAKPPVVEVACGIQFEPIKGLHSGLLGLLWDQYRGRYPRLEQHPPLSPIREQFDPASMRLGFSFEGGFPAPRLWFLSEDGTRLVQVQRDHLIVNWRKLDSGEEYPRYDSIRETLVKEFAIFQDFLKSQGLGSTPVVQTELTYVNQIDARDEKGARKPLSKIVRIWTGETPAKKLPQFEEASFNARFIMRDGDKPTGRLHMNLEPQLFVADNAPLYTLTLIARGAPQSPELEGALASLDNGHVAIVEGFTAVTTDEMHTTWGRTQ